MDFLVLSIHFGIHCTCVWITKYVFVYTEQIKKLFKIILESVALSQSNEFK